MKSKARVMKAAKVDKGSPKPHTDKVGKLTRAQAEEIARMPAGKMPSGRESRLPTLTDRLPVSTALATRIARRIGIPPLTSGKRGIFW